MREQDKQDFEVFKEEFTKWQRRFGLNNYVVYFKHEPLDNAYARLAAEHPTMTATVYLNSRLTADQRKYLDVRRAAKHEAVHLILARLRNLAEERYVLDAEVYEATEEAVNRLQDLIKEK